jgi:chromosome segregation ATPase
MSDDEHIAVTNTVWVNVIEITRERDELRLDLQGLMDESKASTEAMDRARAEIDSLRAYNEMLLKVEREHVAEIERLTVAAHRFEEEARQATFEAERLRADNEVLNNNLLLVDGWQAEYEKFSTFARMVTTYMEMRGPISREVRQLIIERASAFGRPIC